MGRRLPFFIALAWCLHAETRHTLRVHGTVSLDALARGDVRSQVKRPIPRPKRIPSAHIAGPAQVRREAPREVAAGSPAYGGFLALLDAYEATPPDSGGAVGPHDVVTMLNSQVAIHSRTGELRPHYPIDLYQFWSALGSFGKVFDPRILYDPVADRWIAAAGANPGGDQAALLLAISENGDPGGTWDEFQIQTGADGDWADYPVLGLNRKWIVLSANLFALPPVGAYARTEIYAFDKAALYQTATATYSTFSDTHGQFTPAVDLDQQSDSLYFAQTVAAGESGHVRVSLLEGDVGAETFLGGFEDLLLGAGWAEAGSSFGDFAPQKGIWYKVDTGDSRLQNCVLRQGTIWCALTVFLPAESPNRASVQWFQVDPANSEVLQVGRIEDPQGIAFYAFPSIAVNRNGDALVGFTRFTANDYPSAGFALRRADDAANAMRSPVLFKAGEAPYAGLGADEGSNRWGDVSGTMVDPVDDTTFWTIQEFAATPTQHYLGRWGTWWAMVPSTAEALNCTYSVTPSNQQFDAGGGKGTLALTTTPECPWMAATNTAWLTIMAGNTGAGSGTVSFAVPPNATGQPINGTLTIAGQIVAITQAAH